MTGPRAVSPGVGLPLTQVEMSDFLLGVDARVGEADASTRPLPPEAETKEPAPPPVAATPRVTSRRLARAAQLVIVGADAGVILGAMAAAHALLSLEDLDSYRRVSLASFPLWLLTFRRYALYNPRRMASRRLEFGRVLHAVGVGVLLTALVSFGLHQVVARSWLVLVFGLTSAAVMAERIVLRDVFVRLRARGFFIRQVVVVGKGSEATALVRMVGAHAELGYRVVGLLGDGQAVDPRLPCSLPVLDSGADPVEQLREIGAGGVLIATSDVDTETSNRLVRTLTDSGIHVELSSSLKDIDTDRVSVRPLGSRSMVYVAPVRRGGWRPVAKRAFDVVVACSIIVVLAPVMGLVAVVIRATSAGPVLFRQERVGWRGRPFLVLKLRSMYVDGEERLAAHAQAVDLPVGPVVKLRDDPRVTRIGRLVRKLSLDEVPQLVNVLRGEMSLIGPRPEQPCEADLWKPQHFDRLRVRPGLTGMWQISGRSSARSTKDRLDLYYVDNWSIWRDAAIMLKTVPVVLSSKGAY